MIWIYRLFFLPIFLVLFPVHWHKARQRGGLCEKWRERFGIYDLPPDFPPLFSPRPRLWIQAVSVGEILALEPLLQRLREHPSHPLVMLTTTTNTGLATARQHYHSLADFIGYFPVDFFFFQRRAFSTLAPDLLILTESELWPEFLHRARAWGKPVVLINARLSDSSFSRLQRFRPFLQPLLASLSRVLASSPENADRFARILPTHVGVETTGNLKYDFPLPARPLQGERNQKLAELGLHIDPAQPPPLVLLGSSTWPGEEALLLKVFTALRPTFPHLRLILVPRHAERRQSLATELAASSFRFHFRTDPAPANPVEILVADTTGELRHLTALADLAFIGKSLPPHHGGQTPVEAAALGIPAVCGPHMENFRSAVNGLRSSGALLQLANPDAVAEALGSLLPDTTAREAMSAAARTWHSANTGAVERTLKSLETWLKR